MKLTVNGNEVEVTSEADTPLLWVLRDELNLVGTKFGCGIAQCGACTVHLDGVAIRSCVTPVAAVANKDIQTIEGQATAASPGRPSPCTPNPGPRRKSGRHPHCCSSGHR